MREKTCCFTGHRDLDPTDRAVLERRLEQTLLRLIGAGVIYYGAGGALGFDTIASLSVLKLRQRYPQIRLILVLPCPRQTRGWKEEDICIYEQIRQAADKVVYTSDTYSPGCMQKRNRHLVDHSSVCVAFLNKQEGGTKYTWDYACRSGLTVINLAR